MSVINLDELKEIMEKNEDQGMLTFDRCLLKLVQQNKIDPEVALSEADSPSNLRLNINQAAAVVKFDNLREDSF